jgi:7-cyano-7-deazaguanine synthase
MIPFEDEEPAGLAVVCVSGGMDSALAAAMAARRHRLAFLHGNYGQRTEARELESFRRLADHFGVTDRLVVDFSGLRAIGGSSLTDRAIAVREGEPEDGVVPTSYVPFRNAHLLAASVSWAEVLGARAVFVGAVWEDSSGYPDCRPEFYRAFAEAVRLGTRPDSRIEIQTPVIGLSKAEIVRRGVELRVPFELTWSCYQAEVSACGRCESCRLRLRGFSEAGVIDPIPYEEARADARP